MALRVLTILTCIFSIQIAYAIMKLQELFSWNVLDWSYPDERSKKLEIEVESLIPENAIPVGIEKWNHKLFVTVPRWVVGIPATLNYIPLNRPYEPSPKLLPYPSYEGNELGNCENGLNTVYRIKADKCDRLWVLDSGTFGYDTNITRICPPTLYVFDLNSDLRIRKYIFKPEDVTRSTLITNIALDIGSSCSDAFAYFSDELGYGLLVYSWETNKSWRFTHSYFMPDPLRGIYNISGLVFQWANKGIYSIALSPLKEDGYRTLYFSPLSSNTEFAVSTKILRNESRVRKSFADFEIIGFRGPDGHTTAKIMDDSGVQLFSLIDQNSVVCWNSLLPYKVENFGIIDKHDINLVFPSDIKIDEERYVWVISNRMPSFIESILDYGDINFRIFTAPLNTIIEGTPCESQIQVFPKLILPRLARTTMQTTKYLAKKPYIPPGIHKLNIYNASNILNFSIIVSSKTIHYVGPSSIEIPNTANSAQLSSSTINDETTNKMIIFVNSPDFNEIPTNKYVQYSDNEIVTPQIRYTYSNITTNTFYTTTEVSTTRKPKVHISYINNNPIKSFAKVNYPSVSYSAPFLTKLPNSNPPSPRLNTKIFNYENRTPNLNKPIIKNFAKVNINIPAAQIINNKNNKFLNKTSFSYKAIEVTNDQNIKTTALYDDGDYQTITMFNVAPTINNYGNELWYTGNMSRLNRFETTEKTEPRFNNFNPNTLTNKRISQKTNSYNYLPNKMQKYKSEMLVHFPNRREEPKKYSNNANAINNYLSSPTSSPNRVNFINAGYGDETIKKINNKPFKAVSNITKRITNTNSFSNLIKTPSKTMEGKANTIIKVNVLFPTTTVKPNYHANYPYSYVVMHRLGVDIENILKN